MSDHNEWPRDLIHRETKQKQEFKTKDSVPSGWFTIEGEDGNAGVEVNPAPKQKAAKAVKAAPDEPIEPSE